MISRKKPKNQRCREQRTIGARRACTSDLSDAEIRLSSVTISEKIHPEGFTPQMPKTRGRLGPVTVCRLRP